MRIGGFIARIGGTLVLAAVGLVLAVGLAAAQLADPRQAPAIMQEAIAAGDADRIAALFAEDALLLPPTGEVIGGREAIRATYARNFAAGANRLEFGEVRFEGGADRATMLWTWTLAIESVGTTSGRSMVYWRRGEDGWEILVDMFQIPPR